MTVLEETLDKIAMLRSADRAGRMLAGDSSVELAKYAGAIMARMTKEALAPLPLALAKPGAKAVAKKVVTKSPVTDEVRKLMGTAPTMAPGQLPKPPTSMGDVAKRMEMAPAPVGSATPAAKAPTVGGGEAVEKLMGRVPTRLPGVKETGPQEIMARIQHGPAAPAAKASTTGGATGAGTVPPPSGSAKGVRGKAPQMHPSANPKEYEALRALDKSHPIGGYSRAEEYAAKGSAPGAATPAGGVKARVPGPAVGGASPSGYHPMTGSMPVSPQGAAAGHVPGPATGTPAYTPQPTPAAQPYGGVVPPPAQAGAQTSALARLEAAHGPATAVAAAPQQPGRLTQYGQRHGIDTGEGAAGGLASKTPGTVAAPQAAPQTDLGDLRPDLGGLRRPESASFSGKAPPKKGKVAPPEQGEAAAEAAKKGGGLGGLGAKALGLGALGLGAYGLVKGVPWAARQLESGGAGSMAYGGGWSPTSYGYGYSPYGAGAPGATF